MSVKAMASWMAGWSYIERLGKGSLTLAAF